MKAAIQWVLSVVLVAAGIVLLMHPLTARAATPAAGFTPTRFTVVDQGTAGKPDVILIPGLSSSRDVWSAEAQKLAPNYRLHMVQINGFAGQPAGANATGPILPAVVEELHQYIAANKMTPEVVGHSLGGLLALMLADKYPADVRRMVIVDALPFYAVVFNPSATLEMVKPQAEAIRQQMITMPDADFASMQPQMAAGMVKNAEAQKQIAVNSIATDRAVFANAMYEDLQTDLRSEVAGIKTTTLMLYPYDATVVPDVAKIDVVYQTAYKAMPNVKLVRIDDSRHFIMYDQPEKLDAQLQAFLK
ncbi:MAG TPA: alpha/beta hydrolase [Acidobacteriaceae bacterium]